MLASLISEISNEFEEADANKDGKLSLQESLDSTERAIAKIFSKFDKNGDEFIELIELVQAVPYLKVADTNKDGKLSREEIKAQIKQIIEKGLNTLDKNGDGILKLTEII